MRRPTISLVRALFLHRHAVRLLVVGHQKSGTTAIGALLAKLCRRSFANDPLYEYDYGQAGLVTALFDQPETLKEIVLRNRRLFCHYVLKDPDLTFFIPECRKVFPRAKIVFVVRDPRQTVRSIADRLKLSSQDLSKSAEHLTFPNRHWKLILSSGLPNVGGHSVAEVLANRWSMAANQYVENGDAAYLMRYEDFRADREQELRNCLNSLGIRGPGNVRSWLHKQFQPKGSTTADLESRLGGGNLEKIGELCMDGMKRFGYRVVNDGADNEDRPISSAS